MKRRKLIKSGAAGLTLAVLMGAGSAFGGVVFAADGQDDIVAEELSDKESGEANQELVNSEAGINEALDTGESALPPAGDELRQSSGVSAVQSSRDEGGNPSAAAQDNSTDTVKKAEAEVKEEAPVKEGWILENGVYKYYKDGVAYTGWHYMGAGEGEKIPHWSYFAKDGSLYTGWHRMGSNEGEKTAHWSYFGANGWLRTGWVQLGKGTSEPDGNSNRHWSYFGANGWLRTGWVQLGKGTSEPDGNSNRHWSYFGANGWLRTGWVQLGKGTSEPDGNTTKHWSYFGDNGWLRTGWVQLGKGTSEPDGNSNKHWSYFGNNGWLRTGLQTMGNSSNPDGGSKQHLSYFGGNGWLVENNIFTEKNVQYIADSRGWARKAESDYDKTLVRAFQLVDRVTNAGMTKEQKLRACYDHIKNIYPEVRPRTPHYAGEGWHILYANDIFVDKKGNCFSTTAAFAFMAKAIGYENVYAISVNGHGWTEIDGLVYDAERERHHKGSYYALSYNTPIGTQDALEQYQWIFSAKSPYAKIKI